jgi:very-short-patch-repair endonuclease
MRGIALQFKSAGEEEAAVEKQNPVMKERAQKLRRDATQEENTLWYRYLRASKPQWYRQRVIGPYIADFYCKQCRLVVELDGGQHYNEQAASYDAKRSAYFESEDILVLRFTNTDVRRRFYQVCEMIDHTVKQRMNETPHPSR